MSKLLNLDKLVKDDKIIILNGDECYIPGDLPVKIAIKMQKAGKDLTEDSSNVEHVKSAYSVLHEILIIRNKDFMNLDEFMDTINTEQYVALCNFIAGVEPEETKPDSSGKKKELEE